MDDYLSGSGCVHIYIPVSRGLVWVLGFLHTSLANSPPEAEALVSGAGGAFCKQGKCYKLLHTYILANMARFLFYSFGRNTWSTVQHGSERDPLRFGWHFVMHGSWHLCELGWRGMECCGRIYVGSGRMVCCQIPFCCHFRWIALWDLFQRPLSEDESDGTLWPAKLIKRLWSRVVGAATGNLSCHPCSIYCFFLRLDHHSDSGRSFYTISCSTTVSPKAPDRYVFAFCKVNYKKSQYPEYKFLPSQLLFEAAQHDTKTEEPKEKIIIRVCQKPRECFNKHSPTYRKVLAV